MVAVLPLSPFSKASVLSPEIVTLAHHKCYTLVPMSFFFGRAKYRFGTRQNNQVWRCLIVSMRLDINTDFAFI